MKHITPRELMDVEHDLKTGLVYGILREYLESRLVESRIQARVLAGNLASLLEREQLLGQINLLESFHDDFHNHVKHVVTKNNEQQDNDNAT